MNAPDVLWQAHAAVLLFLFLGFSCLALAMDRHQEDLFGQVLHAHLLRSLRTVGWMMLLLALAMSVSSMGWGFGLVAYSGHASAAAGLVFLLLLFSNRFRSKRG